MSAFPSEKDIAGLPRWGKVYLAARSARRAVQMLGDNLPSGFEVVLSTLEKVESAAAQGIPISSGDISPARERFLGLYSSNSRFKGTSIEAAALAVDDAFGLASIVVDHGRGFEPSSYQARKLLYAIGCAVTVERIQGGEPLLLDLVTEDLQQLLSMSQAGQWTDMTPVPGELLILNSSLEVDSFESPAIFELRSAISDELIRWLAEHPRHLYTLDPRKFEELIARVFEGYGFSVELTAPVRDGGRDIIALSYSPAKVKYLVECKRYAEGNKVGLKIVQRLHGVVQGEDATIGVLATTSEFTRPAQDFLIRPTVRYRLDGRDFEGVRQWLINYDQLRMRRQLPNKRGASGT